MNEPLINEEKIKGKRGRKTKQYHQDNNDNNNNNENIVLLKKEKKKKIEIIPENDNESFHLKKRGRKPKGGKIIHKSFFSSNGASKQNIILHLKCFLKDLDTDFFCKDCYTGCEKCMNNKNNTKIGPFDIINNSSASPDSFHPITSSCLLFASSFEHVPPDNNNIDNNNNVPTQNNTNNISEIIDKIRELEKNLHLNNISEKKSACFWCTYDFDNPPIYIPKKFLKEMYHVYGCFCSPECAAAFLMQEKIDESCKFERYSLLNQLYSEIIEINTNIKPAPNPFYMLNKYYGNLSIFEYRALFKSNCRFLIINKPLTRVLPELYEDNETFIINDNKTVLASLYNNNINNMNNDNKEKMKYIQKRKINDSIKSTKRNGLLGYLTTFGTD